MTLMDRTSHSTPLGLQGLADHHPVHVHHEVAVLVAAGAERPAEQVEEPGLVVIVGVWGDRDGGAGVVLWFVVR